MTCQSRAVLLTGFLATASCAPPSSVDAVFDGSAGEWVDLTHTLSEDAVFWPTATPFEMREVAYGVTDGGFFYAAFDLSMAEHGGTHLDAPIHFAEGRHAADEIPLERFVGPAAVVRVVAGPDYLVTVSDLERWEDENGPIPPGTIVLLDTGWSGRWPDRTAYLGTSRTGAEAVPELHFPGLAPAAAQWLVDNRSIDAVGIDTPSIDYGQSSTYEAHRILYGANIPGFENVAQLDRLPATGAFVVALPTKIQGGSGAPLRIIAYIPG